jgi:hypothetical protein
MTKEQEAAYHLGVTDAIKGVRTMLEESINSTEDIDAIPTRMALQVVLAALSQLEESIANVPTPSN